MVIEHNYSPKFFRARAEEFRRRADNCEIDRTKHALWKVAATYEERAKHAEQVRAAKEAAE